MEDVNIEITQNEFYVTENCIKKNSEEIEKQKTKRKKEYKKRCDIGKEHNSKNNKLEKKKYEKHKNITYTVTYNNITKECKTYKEIFEFTKLPLNRVYAAISGKQWKDLVVIRNKYDPFTIDLQ